MTLLVRSWNLFHGNTLPPTRRSHLREMVKLVVADRPDVVCLQEIPVWALPRLTEWSGLQVFPAIARHGLRAAGLAGWVTRLDNGHLRSAITGQANVILVVPDHDATDLGHVQISDRGGERRVCQAVRVAEVVVANLHASGGPTAVAAPGAPVVLAGDFNVVAPELAGYSSPGPGIDHVLVRGAPSTPLTVWSTERRMQNGRVLSDHPPVELSVG